MDTRKLCDHVNAFGHTDYEGVTYTGRCSFFGDDGSPVVSVSLGWGILFGGGMFLAAVTTTLMTITIKLDKGKRQRVSGQALANRKLPLYPHP